jgi:hypothetical protein
MGKEACFHDPGGESVGFAKGRLGVDHPVLRVERNFKTSEGRRLDEVSDGLLGTRAWRELGGVKQARQTGEEFPAKQLAENLDREQEFLGRIAPHAVGAEAAASYDAVKVRVKTEIAGPGMNNAGNADSYPGALLDSQGARHVVVQGPLALWHLAGDHHGESPTFWSSQFVIAPGRDLPHVLVWLRGSAGLNARPELGVALRRMGPDPGSGRGPRCRPCGGASRPTGDTVIASLDLGPHRGLDRDRL